MDYIYKLSVCVTKNLTYSQHKEIIDRFVQEKLTFGLVPGVKKGLYVMWRDPLPDEKIRVEGKEGPGKIISKIHPTYNEFVLLYDQGIKIVDKIKNGGKS